MYSPPRMKRLSDIRPDGLWERKGAMRENRLSATQIPKRNSVSAGNVSDSWERCGTACGQVMKKRLNNVKDLTLLKTPTTVSKGLHDRIEHIWCRTR